MAVTWNGLFFVPSGGKTASGSSHKEVTKCSARKDHSLQAGPSLGAVVISPRCYWGSCTPAAAFHLNNLPTSVKRCIRLPLNSSCCKVSPRHAASLLQSTTPQKASFPPPPLALRNIYHNHASSPTFSTVHREGNLPPALSFWHPLRAALPFCSFTLPLLLIH